MEPSGFYNQSQRPGNSFSSVSRSHKRPKSPKVNFSDSTSSNNGKHHKSRQTPAIVIPRCRTNPQPIRIIDPRKQNNSSILKGVMQVLEVPPKNPNFMIPVSNVHNLTSIGFSDRPPPMLPSMPPPTSQIPRSMPPSISFVPQLVPAISSGMGGKIIPNQLVGDHKIKAGVPKTFKMTDWSDLVVGGGLGLRGSQESRGNRTSATATSLVEVR